MYPSDLPFFIKAFISGLFKSIIGLFDLFSLNSSIFDSEELLTNLLFKFSFRDFFSLKFHLVY